MRLLQVDENGQFSLTRDNVDNIPPYAILSHTWGGDDDEVTFQDLTQGLRETKPGYRKLRFCGQQAARDGLQYFWVDTCCINKSNNTELSEAINSMFRWYSRAAKCYVYLSDVSTNGHDQTGVSSPPWEPAFRSSRWFTRGWTLQELLGPPSVEFFCSSGNRLGDKMSLKRQIHDITGIAAPALEGTPLSEFSVEERMSWAKSRQTKREEDRAYSLLGIFEIYMPLIYGEGSESAFRRLYDEISKNSRPSQDPTPLGRLPYAVESPFNSYAKRHEPICLPDTRVSLLQDIHVWATGQDDRSIFWLNGLAGTGKSTVARTVARDFFDRDCLAASVFFSRGGGDVSHAGKFVTSIAVQLANSIPTLRQYVSDVVLEHNDIVHQSLRDQWHKLVLGPLSNLDSKGRQSMYVLVIDALDECSNENDIQTILHLLVEARSLQKVRFRVFLTSRPDLPIRYGFSQIPDNKYQDFVLHNISPSIVDRDITIFFKYNLSLIRLERSLDASWPGEEAVKVLVQSASGLFIWAATACRFIREGKRHVARRLEIILGSAVTATAPGKYLDEIYSTVLKHSVPSEYTDEEKEMSYRLLRQVLGSIIILFTTLSAYSLSRLLHIPQDDVDQTMEDLHSILDVPNDRTQHLRLHHPSFRDFLLDSNRCQEPSLWVEEKRAHLMLADGCIRLMSTVLKQDICGQDAPGTLATDVDSNRVKQCLPPELQYACLYWIPHLRQNSPRLRDNDQVHTFLQKHLLHWIEALGWMQKVSEGIHAITSLELLSSLGQSPRLSAFVHDAKRFLLYNRLVIELAPLQIYSSALIFAPAASITRKQFEADIPTWVQRLPEVESNWNALLQTLEGHSGHVNDVVFSPNGKSLATGSDDTTAKLWDAGTGAVLQTLRSHSNSIYSVAFSPNGKTLASASEDRTVKLWDTGSGALWKTLNCHSGVFKVDFSPDGKMLASTSRDKEIRLWDASLGINLHTLSSHSKTVENLIFLPDSKTLISALWDGTITLWDINLGAILETYSTYPMSAIVFSRDGKSMALAYGKAIKLWDTNSGAVLQTFEDHSDAVYCIALSADRERLASALKDGTVKLWEISSGKMLWTFQNHSESANTVSFSPDNKILVSGYSDNTLKIWDISLNAIPEIPKTLEGHSDLILHMVFSPDGKRLVSASRDTTFKLWDTSSGAMLQTFNSGLRVDHAMAFSPDSKTLALASYTTTKLVEASSGLVLLTLEGRSDISSIAFSSDGSMLVSAAWDGVVEMWDVNSGVLVQILQGRPNYGITVAFSPNSKILASTLDKNTIKLCDTSSGAVLQTLNGPSQITALAFSPGGDTLASASLDCAVWLWKVSSGVVRRTLKGHLHLITAISFSPDGERLASASYNATVKLWSARSGALLQTYATYSPLTSLSFSEDGTFIRTNRGPLYSAHLSSTAAHSKLDHFPSIFVGKDWVMRNGHGVSERLLWLPREYRPREIAVSGSIVAFGYDSGQVLFMELAF